MPLLAILVYACSDSSDDTDGNSGGNSDSFDRGALLVTLADDQIIPAYASLNTELAGMQTAMSSFVNFAGMIGCWDGPCSSSPQPP